MLVYKSNENLKTWNQCKKQIYPNIKLNEESFSKNSHVISKAFISGYSSWGIDNIVWNKKKGYFAYPTTNKIVIDAVK